MPPKVKFTKENIAKTAFEIIRRDGYGALNARALATELGTSTMPLFHHYENMDEIKKSAVTLAVQRYNEYMRAGMLEPLPFKGVGRAYIKFAQEEPQLFRMFFMMPTGEITGLPEIDPNTELAVNIASSATDGSRETGEDMLRSMWIFVHGIATLAVTGKTKFSDEEISKMTSEVFRGLCLAKEDIK